MPLHKTISLDAMGGDFGPEATIPGAARALDELESARFLLSGDEAAIKPVLERYPDLRKSSEIIHAETVVNPDDKPSTVLRTGRKSSMRLAINAVEQGQAGSVVSSGNTGALMAMAKLVLKTLPGIHRPAIASVFPSMKSDLIMLDLGANVECNARNLVQFAILGAVYARLRQGETTKPGFPSVGLLNVGTEEMKGRDEIREAWGIMREIEFPGTFHGFIEGNDIPRGTVDVVVTDGFTGNVALKIAEGMGEMTGQFVREALTSSLLSKIGAALACPGLKRLKKRVDPRFYNGGMFLGLNGICVKSHGNSDSYGYSRAILVAARLADEGYIDRVAEEVAHMAEQETRLKKTIVTHNDQ